MKREFLSSFTRIELFHVNFLLNLLHYTKWPQTVLDSVLPRSTHNPCTLLVWTLPAPSNQSSSVVDQSDRGSGSVHEQLLSKSLWPDAQWCKAAPTVAHQPPFLIRKTMQSVKLLAHLACSSSSRTTHTNQEDPKLKVFQKEAQVGNRTQAFLLKFHE